MKSPHSLSDSFRDAFCGIATALRTERNMRIHFAALFLLVALGLWVGLMALEWALVLLSAGSVLALELMNSAVERAVDLAEPQEHPLAAQSKNLAAGGVLVTAIVAILVGLLIIGPKLFALLGF